VEFESIQYENCRIQRFSFAHFHNFLFCRDRPRKRSVLSFIYVLYFRLVSSTLAGERFGLADVTPLDSRICMFICANRLSAQSDSLFSNKISNSSLSTRIGNIAAENAAGITPSPSSNASVTTVTWKYEYSSFGDPKIDLQPNGRGEEYAFACQSAQVSYSRASSAARSAGSTIISYSTYVSVTTYSSGIADIYTTLCDKLPRAHGSGPVSSVPIYSTTTLSDYSETKYNSQIPSIQPSCNINANDCAPLISSYSSELAAFNQFQSSLTQPFYVTPKPQSPACSPPISVSSGCTTCCGQCTIAGGTVKLLYWPVTVEGDFCGQRTTITNNATTTQSLVSNGMTYVSPSVYISFQSLYAFDDCSSEIGRRIEGTILAMQPDKLSSARGNHLAPRTPYSLNFADLNVPVPGQYHLSTLQCSRARHPYFMEANSPTASAYCAQVKYDWIPCDTIYDEGYTSLMLWLPDEVSSMRPEWSTCRKAIWGIYDPPHALQTVNELTPDASSSLSKETPVLTPAKTTSAALVTGHQTATAAPVQTRPELPKSTQRPGNSPSPETPVPNSQDQDNQDPVNPRPISDVPENIGSVIASVIGLVKPGKVGTGNAAGSMVTAAAERFGSAGIVVHGTTIPFLQLGDGYYASITTDASGARILVMAPGSTLTVGGKATTINGHTLTAGNGGVIVDGTATLAYAGFISTLRNSSAGTAGVLQVTKSEGSLIRVSGWMGFLFLSFVVELVLM
jgi:hypothetical protein